MSAIRKPLQSSIALPKKIGRFEPVSILGRGGQGVVYLAKDPKIGRNVALKTLLRSGRDPQQLLVEAKNVAQLDHPGIVPLYEFELNGDLPYLVYQYAPGNPLATLMGNNQKPTANRAIRIISSVLDAMSYAHGRGVLHRDLSPGNILIHDDDQTRILDFGVSTILDAGATTAEMVGTVNYLPPECLANESAGPHSDLFSITVIFHELLTGKQLFAADNHMAVVYKILNEKIVAPSIRNPEIDPGLDAIVMQGLERDPKARYRTTADMKAALDAYLKPAAGPTAGNSESKGSAIKFMLRRAARKPDFPAVSRYISEISKKTETRNRSNAADLGDVVVKDFALTSKLLRLVNSAVYGQYGGTISTVSRAIVVLGFNQVRAAALSIAVFEHLQNGEQADVLKDASCSSFLSAMLARELGAKSTGIDTEQAFMAGMFHRLGRHLTIYYFPQEFEEIRALVTSKGITESAAAQEIFGASFADFGVAVGHDWNLPKNLLVAMMPLKDGTVTRAKSLAGQTSQIAAFANEVAEAVGAADSDSALESKLARLSERFSDCVPSDVKSLRQSVAIAMKETRDYADILSVDVESATFFQNVVRRIEGGKTDSQPKAEGAHAEVGPTGNSNTAGTAGLESPSPENIQIDPPEDRSAYLVNALSELSVAMLDDVSINDVFSMVIKAFYNGMSFSRVLLMIKDPKRHVMQARSGFGENIEELLPKFNFKTGHHQDIFNLATRKHKEYIVLDVEAEQYTSLIPDWCKALTDPLSLVLFPIVANKNCIGLIYADQIDRPATISSKEFKMLMTLIRQASLAIQQRR